MCLETASFDTNKVNANLPVDPKTRVTTSLPFVLAVLSCRSREMLHQRRLGS